MRGGTESFIKNSVCVDTQGEPHIIEPSELVLNKQWQCTQTCTRRTTGVRVTMRTCRICTGRGLCKVLTFSRGGIEEVEQRLLVDLAHSVLRDLRDHTDLRGQLIPG